METSPASRRVALWPGIALAISLSAGACGGRADLGNDTPDGSALVTGCTQDSDCASQVPPTTPANCAAGTCNAAGSCVFAAKDQDGDGHAAASCASTNATPVTAGDDCDDSDPNLYPGHAEACAPTSTTGADVACGWQKRCTASGGVSACASTTNCSGGEICSADGQSCGAGCDIGGTTVASGAANPANACQTCQPNVSTTAWTTLASGMSCGTGEVCVNGACTSGCFIGGVAYAPGTLDPANACQSCQANVSTTAWTTLTSGTRCGPDQVCVNGVCSAGCFVNGANIPTGSACATGGTCCGGACVDEATDTNNCGTCGHSCQGGACAASACQPVVLASGGSPWDLAVDATSVYWTDDGKSAVLKVGLNGAGITTLASSGQESPRGIAVDATSVYWAEGGPYSGDVVKVALDGTGLATLFDGLNPWDIAVDSTNVYWTYFTSGGAVFKQGLDGSGLATLASGNYPARIVVDATSVYWTVNEDGTVMKAALDGTGLTTLASGQYAPYGIAVDATSVYWTNFTGGTVMKATLYGTGLTTLASGQAYGIAVDATSVYWTDHSSNTIMKAALDGTGLATLAAGQISPMFITVDATSIYWSNSGTAGRNDGAVMKLAK